MSLSKILQAVRSGPTGDALAASDQIFEAVAASVEEHMSAYDASHNFEHVLRVLKLCQLILRTEAGSPGPVRYDPTVVLLSGLLHDVTDKKYNDSPSSDSKLAQILSKAGVAPDTAAAVIAVVNHVSYSSEVRDPAQTMTVLAQHPELGIVQDADRLDAIGAIGIGRMFTFGGAKMPQSSMQLTREHIRDKLVKLEGMMKTDTGKIMAQMRTERIELFAEWWDEEWSLAERV